MTMVVRVIDIIRIAFESTVNDIKKILLIILLFSGLFSLVFYYLTYYESVQYEVLEVKNVWKVNEKEILHLKISPVGPEDYEFGDRVYEFYNELKNKDYVTKIGRYYIIDNDNKYHLYADDDIFEIFNTKKDKSASLFWPEGQGIFSGEKLLYEINIEDVHIMQDENFSLAWMYFQSIYFLCDENEKLNSDVMELSKKWNLGVIVENLEDVYNEFLNDHQYLFEIYKPQFILFVFSAIVIVASVMLIIYNSNRKNNAILLINGYPRMVLVLSTLLSATIIMYLSVLGMIFIAYYGIMPSFYDDYIWMNAARKYAIPLVICIAAIINMVGCVVPIIKIINIDVIEEIRRSDI